MKLRLIFTLLVLVAAVTAFDCKKGGSDDRYAFFAPDTTRLVTDKGVALKSFRDVPASYKPIVDDALTKSFDRARQAGYTLDDIHAKYTVGFWERSPKCINPGFLINADGQALYPDGWDNHPDYDKDPRKGTTTLCIAGITAYGTYGTNNPDGSFGMLVVNDAATLPNIVWFESEHEILLFVDINRWVATMGVHAHPIIEVDAQAQIKKPDTVTVGPYEGQTVSIGGRTYVSFTYRPEQNVTVDGALVAEKGKPYCVLLTN